MQQFNKLIINIPSSNKVVLHPAKFKLIIVFGKYLQIITTDSLFKYVQAKFKHMSLRIFQFVNDKIKFFEQL